MINATIEVRGKFMDDHYDMAISFWGLSSTCMLVTAQCSNNIKDKKHFIKKSQN